MLTINDILRTERAIVSFRACIFCHSIRVYPYLGFMTGQQYQCQDCDEISPLVLEFDTEEDFSEFLKEVEEE